MNCLGFSTTCDSDPVPLILSERDGVLECKGRGSEEIDGLVDTLGLRTLWGEGGGFPDDEQVVTGGEGSTAVL